MQSQFLLMLCYTSTIQIIITLGNSDKYIVSITNCLCLWKDLLKTYTSTPCPKIKVLLKTSKIYLKNLLITKHW